MSFKKFITYIFILSQIACVSNANTIKIGVMAGPSIQIIEAAKKIAFEKYNLTVKTVVFTNYIMPNEALNSGDIDLNIFQTSSFLNKSIEKNNYKITSIANTFIYPMGFYSKKIQNIRELKNNSTIAIPNDASNQGRALLLLQSNNLIKLKNANDEFATTRDIIENPKNLRFVSMDGSQIARAIQDVDGALLNNDFVLNAGFKAKDAILSETAQIAKPYINVIVTQTNNKNTKDFITFAEIMHSKEIINKTFEIYPNAIVAW